MKSGGRSPYFLNPYTNNNNNSDHVRTEFYNLRSNGNLEQILIKSRRRNSWKARVSLQSPGGLLDCDNCRIVQCSLSC